MGAERSAKQETAVDDLLPFVSGRESRLLTNNVTGSQHIPPAEIGKGPTASCEKGHYFVVCERKGARRRHLAELLLQRMIGGHAKSVGSQRSLNYSSNKRPNWSGQTETVQWR